MSSSVGIPTAVPWALSLVVGATRQELVENRRPRVKDRVPLAVASSTPMPSSTSVTTGPRIPGKLLMSLQHDSPRNGP